MQFSLAIISAFLLGSVTALPNGAMLNGDRLNKRQTTPPNVAPTCADLGSASCCAVGVGMPDDTVCEGCSTSMSCCGVQGSGDDAPPDTFKGKGRPCSDAAQ